MQDSATLDLTGKELGNMVCFDTCKEDPNCGGVYIKVKKQIYTFLMLYVFYIYSSKLAVDFKCAGQYMSPS